MTDAQFTFSSMIHRGFFADASAQTSVMVTVSGQPPLTRQVAMMTPGDVIGIPNRQIIRCTPPNGLSDAEPNYLAAVEFDSPDLPWMFSRKSASGPTLPWITLAVIDETALTVDPLSPSPLGTKLTIDSAQLPNPAESWMWAHSQLLGSDTVPDDPSRSLSRLISSRRLQADHRYLACVVPVFAAGRDAGLGEDPGPVRTSMDLAWGGAGGDVTLPVYYFWRFATGPNGDFESLVRRLHGVALPAGLGRRRLQLDFPMSGLPAPDAAGADLDLHVALQPPGETLDDIAPLVGQSYLDSLRSRLVDAGYDVSLLTSNPDAPPVVGPPVYGQLAAGPSATVGTLDTTAPPWVRQTNLDPRLRVAAGLGSEVVRRNQDRYVEEAWRQVGAVLAANALRRRAEFSLAASATLHRRWISQLPAADLVTSTAPVHSRVLVAAGQTLTGRLRQSPLPPSIVSVEYRRVTRARGNLTGAARWSAATGPTVLGQKSAEPHPLSVDVPLDTIDALEPPSQVWGIAAVPGILARLVPDLDQTTLTPAQAATQLDALSQLETVRFVAPADVPTKVGSIDGDAVLSAAGMVPTSQPSPTGPVHGHPVAGQPISTQPVAGQPHIAHGTAATQVASSTISREVFGQIASGTFVQPAAPALKFTIPPVKLTPLRLQISDVAKALLGATIVATDASALPITSLVNGFDTLRATIVGALDPSKTIVSMVNSQISSLTAPQAAVFDDIMAAPALSEPTYQALADISHDWILPGVDALPADTTTLVESNRAFINAFLVGMNHELARELLWREYPTDQRGTYSRQFWSHRDTGNPADQYDLTHLLHEVPTRDLPALSDRPGEVAAPLVLVVKGDVVRRYPGIIVTAAHTKKSGAGRAMDPATEIQPDFTARLDPDVLLVGFNSLSADLVWSAAGNEDTAWWFFFAEHFTEPRFGLDEPTVTAPATPTDWNDASWGDAALDADGRLCALSFVGGAIPKTAPGGPAGPTFNWHSNSSSVAWILLQYPFRRGVRGTDLLPPRPVA
ncbi:hypothetical protein [Mycobacterium sp.]|uniref:hypothetical protein n=1 Tax=Mycobacterium sp. TaxID=1785 RepID=UPI002CB115B4|nr:hypothetical protein [Mycobacterium sp.]HKP44570.1 hypothetical protein [Mycobacterium sp.]